MENYHGNPNVYIKKNVSHKEYFMQKYVYRLNIVNVPEIIDYDDKAHIMVMNKVDNNNLSDQYGEEATDIPDKIFDQVIKIVRTLVLHNIEYPDLTGYNFIEDKNGKIWIIDFEHSKMMTSTRVDNKHIQNICNGCKTWNPDFR